MNKSLEGVVSGSKNLCLRIMEVIINVVIEVEWKNLELKVS